MKKILLAIFLMLFSCQAFSQKGWAEKIRDSSLLKLQTATDDKTRLELNFNLFYSYIWSYPDSALPYAHKTVLLAQKLKSSADLMLAYDNMAMFSIITGNYPQALKYSLEALKIAEQTKAFNNIAYAYSILSYTYYNQGDYARAILYAKKGKSIYEDDLSFSVNSISPSDNMVDFMHNLSALAHAFEKNNQLDSALKYALRYLGVASIFIWKHLH